MQYFWIFISSKVKSFIFNIKRTLNWLPIIWGDRDYDYYFLLEAMRHKLKLMEKFFNDDDLTHAADSRQSAYRIKVCRILLDRLMEDNYFEMASKGHDEKWGYMGIAHMPADKEGHSEIKVLYDGVKTEQDRIQQRRDFKRIFEHEAMLRKQDIEYLFKLMSKHILKWWD